MLLRSCLSWLLSLCARCCNALREPEICVQSARMHFYSMCNALRAQFTGADGNPLAIKGVNWFGFETDATMVGGLWQVRSRSFGSPA